jgi:hypothetical protein
VPQRPHLHARVGRKDRTGRGGAYRWASLVSAVMLTGIGPVKPFLFKSLVVHNEACGRAERAAKREPRAARQVSHRRKPGQGVGAHRYVSAVSAEIVGGTVPTRPG